MQYTLCKANGVYTLLLSSRTDDPFLIHDIARTLANAYKIGNIFAENLVLPCHAPEILDDLLAGGEFF